MIAELLDGWPGILPRAVALQVAGVLQVTAVELANGRPVPVACAERCVAWVRRYAASWPPIPTGRNTVTWTDPADDRVQLAESRVVQVRVACDAVAMELRKRRWLHG